MEVFAELPLELRHRISAMATDAYVLAAIGKFESFHTQACWIVAVQPDGQALFLRRGPTDAINTGNWQRCSDGRKYTGYTWGVKNPVRPTDGARLFGVLDRWDSGVNWRKVVTAAASDQDLHDAAAVMFLALRRLHRADPSHM